MIHPHIYTFTHTHTRARIHICTYITVGNYRLQASLNNNCTKPINSPCIQQERYHCQLSWSGQLEQLNQGVNSPCAFNRNDITVSNSVVKPGRTTKSSRQLSVYSANEGSTVESVPQLGHCSQLIQKNRQSVIPVITQPISQPNN